MMRNTFPLIHPISGQNSLSSSSYLVNVVVVLIEKAVNDIPSAANAHRYCLEYYNLDIFVPLLTYHVKLFLNRAMLLTRSNYLPAISSWLSLSRHHATLGTTSTTNRSRHQSILASSDASGASTNGNLDATESDPMMQFLSQLNSFSLAQHAYKVILRRVMLPWVAILFSHLISLCFSTLLPRITSDFPISLVLSCILAFHVTENCDHWAMNKKWHVHQYS